MFFHISQAFDGPCLPIGDAYDLALVPRTVCDYKLVLSDLNMALIASFLICCLPISNLTLA